MAVTFKDKKNTTVLINPDHITRLHYNEDRRYFMVHYLNDQETYTFSSVDERDKVLEELKIYMDVQAIST